jgi:hypothetical protein
MTEGWGQVHWDGLEEFWSWPNRETDEATATLGRIGIVSPEVTLWHLHSFALWCGHRVRVCFTEFAFIPLNYQNADCVLSEQMREPHSIGVHLILGQTCPDNFMKREPFFEKMKKFSTVVWNPSCRWHYQKIWLYSGRGIYFIPWHPSSFTSILILSKFVSMYPKLPLLFIFWTQIFKCNSDL